MKFFIFRVFDKFIWLLNDDGVKRLKIGIVGGGLAGLSTAGYLAKMGHNVTLLEKNKWLGGRVRSVEEAGFRFDTGVFTFSMISEIDKWFSRMGYDRADFYEMRKTSSRYKIFFDQTEVLEVPTDLWHVKNLFERYEIGGARKLDLFLKNSEFKYNYFIDRLAYKNYYSVSDFFNDETTFSLSRLNMLVSASTFNARYFKSNVLQKILEAPFYFKGMDPSYTPAFFNLLNYNEFENGLYTVVGGVSKIAESMENILKKMGVKIVLGAEVYGLAIENMEIKKVLVKTLDDDENLQFDVIVNACDYNWFESLLPPHYRNINPVKIERSASWMTFCVALDTELKNLNSVNIFYKDGGFLKGGLFNEDLKIGVRSGRISFTRNDTQKQTNDTLILNAINRNDSTASPDGKDSLVMHIPLKNIADSDLARATVFNECIDLLDTRLGTEIKKHIIFRKSYFRDDYKADFNSFFGDSFGPSMTIKQLFFRRMSNKSKRVLNLYHAGQNTIPGNGAVFSLISGYVTSQRIMDELYSC